MAGHALRRIEKSQTLLINEQSRGLEQQGKTIYKFGFGQSPFPPPAFIVERLRETAHMKDYSPVQGLLELREAAAAFHRKIDKLDIEADNVLVAPGSKILIYAAMAAFTKANVLIPVPSWVSYAPQARLLGHMITPIMTAYEQAWRVTPELLEQAAKTNADAKLPLILILNYPGNPDGLSYTSAELAALAAVARKHQITIIADEIYGLLHHTGRHESIACHYPEGAIVTGGMSKWCGAGGWRLGIAMLPKAMSGEFKNTMLGIGSETYSCAATPIQMAAVAAYQSITQTVDYLAHKRRVLAALGMMCHHKLHDSGIRVHAPQGGFYLFLDFSGLKQDRTAAALCERLLRDTGVALLPGSAFGMPKEHLSARLCYVDFDGDRALAASEAQGLSKPIDADFLNAHCPKVIAGIDALCRWASAA